ncbi:MAG: bifunctional 5,10-methylenetetrahydrofolate dehydrogenase/5,10-methenyltetrahydrofolate cyclohydrolase [bacterium]|nr:bifunctional 5,10-methylenetetrahydrofolate dehydrogenase/5,10-methenyltetrahydrofolate cyclohydrolase [bacterium]
MTTIFDGFKTARAREVLLEKAIHDAKLVAPITIQAIVFIEDEGSMLYTRLKTEAAERVGIEYQATQFSLTDPTEIVLAAITAANKDTKITGIIVQKPSRVVYESVGAAPYSQWWLSLVSAIDPKKDVDGLHPETLKTGSILPATCRAVLAILSEALGGSPERIAHQGKKISIIGRSDLLGKPLTQELLRQGAAVELLGKKDLAARQATGESLLTSDVVVSATGVANLITPDMVKDGVIAIDVGEPQPDISRAVANKASFFTPVPGGVGPMTVVSLLENSLSLANGFLALGGSFRVKQPINAEQIRAHIDYSS